MNSLSRRKCLSSTVTTPCPVSAQCKMHNGGMVVFKPASQALLCSPWDGKVPWTIIWLNAGISILPCIQSLSLSFCLYLSFSLPSGDSEVIQSPQGSLFHTNKVWVFWPRECLQELDCSSSLSFNPARQLHKKNKSIGFSCELFTYLSFHQFLRNQPICLNVIGIIYLCLINAFLLQSCSKPTQCRASITKTRPVLRCPSASGIKKKCSLDEYWSNVIGCWRLRSGYFGTSWCWSCSSIKHC